MKLLVPITVFALLTTSRLPVFLPVASQKAPVASEPVAAPRKLVWSDEFTTDGVPDPAKWGYDVGGNGWGNKELQYYTKDRKENARVENGHLIIEAHKEAFQGRDYTSARLLTKNTATWMYGRFEIKAKLPSGVGTWPAIWMLGKNIATAGWPLSGEIDIMEHVGFDQGVVHGTIHSEAYNHVRKTEKGKHTSVPTASTEFHVYSIDWTAEQIDFAVDGQVYNSVTKAALGKTEAQWPFDQPFYLIMNIAVGGGWGGQKGVDETIWPRRMEVDYVRIYQ
ncbi:glycoside hydrolase family 16 protein [Fibrella arboris]|uniref:glycoside hydrolase family 16 protein n=1 Tax=Fibrella arboris TaxID=3242486 RepID=UPI00351FB6F9